MPLILDGAHPQPRVPLRVHVSINGCALVCVLLSPADGMQVSEIEVQANRAKTLMGDLARMVPDVELQMGPLLKVRRQSKCKLVTRGLACMVQKPMNIPRVTGYRAALSWSNEATRAGPTSRTFISGRVSLAVSPDERRTLGIISRASHARFIRRKPRN